MEDVFDVISVFVHLFLTELVVTNGLKHLGCAYSEQLPVAVDRSNVVQLFSV